MANLGGRKDRRASKVRLNKWTLRPTDATNITASLLRSTSHVLQNLSISLGRKLARLSSLAKREGCELSVRILYNHFVIDQFRLEYPEGFLERLGSSGSFIKREYVHV